MIRILTSLVALFTVTSIHTHAAFNQFSRLINEVVDEQKSSANPNLIRQTFTKEIFQQLVQRKTSFTKKNKSQHLFDLNLSDQQFLFITSKKKQIAEYTEPLYYRTRAIFHIRSPNLYA